jgi:hypothetical protein
VPGTTIITEGTDGLSRGIWISHMHSMPSQNQVLTEIFSPVPFTPDVSQWAINEIGLPPTIPCLYRSWELEWRPRDIFDRLTIWTPPPEVAPQLI